MKKYDEAKNGFTKEKMFNNNRERAFWKKQI